MITNFTHSIACWHGKDVLRLSWKYQGKDVRAVLMAKNGARYIPVKPVDARFTESDYEIAEGLWPRMSRAELREKMEENAALLAKVKGEG